MAISDYRMSSMFHAFLCIIAPAFLPETPSNRNTQTMQSEQLIKELKTHSFDLIGKVPLFGFVCNQAAQSMSTYSDRDQWNESTHLFPSDNVSLVPFLSILFVFTVTLSKHMLLSLGSYFSDFLGRYVPYCILWPSFLIISLFKLTFVSFPMSCCSLIKTIFWKIWSFILFITTPLRWLIRKIFNCFAYIWLKIWECVKWCCCQLPTGSRKGIYGEDVEAGRVGVVLPDPKDGKSSKSTEESPEMAAFTKQVNGIVNTLMTDKANGNSKRKAEINKESSLREYENSLKQSEEELEEDRKFRERGEELRKQTEETKRKLSELNNRPVPSDNEEEDEEQKKVDEEFREKLDKQKRAFEEQLEQLRKQRAEIERETEEELNRIREESQQRIQVFLKCVQMKIRFEEKEREWGDMLSGLRRPLVTVCTSYYDLQSVIQETLKYGLESEMEEFKHSVKSFGSKLVTAQNLMAQTFDHLKQLSEDYDDRVFIKIIMVSLSDIGCQCDRVGNTLVKVFSSPSEESLKELDGVMSSLSPHSIPTTTGLRNDSQTARNQDYANINEPPFEEWFHLLQ